MDWNGQSEYRIENADSAQVCLQFVLLKQFTICFVKTNLCSVELQRSCVREFTIHDKILALLRLYISEILWEDTVR